MSGGNQINNTGQITQTSSAAPASQPPATQPPKSLLARTYEYFTSLPSMAAGAASGWIARSTGREVTGTDVTSAVISSGKLAVDLANSFFSAYNTPESRLAISLLLTLSAGMADRHNRHEKIRELDELQNDFLNSLTAELIEKITVNRNGTNEIVNYTNNSDLTEEFKACSLMTIKLKTGIGIGIRTDKEVSLYNMHQSSGYAITSNSSAKVAMTIAVINIGFIAANYACRTSPIATGTLTADNGFNANITIDSTANETYPNAVQLNGGFQIAGVSAGYTINDTALHEAHLAASAANQTLSAYTINQLLTPQTFSINGNFTGSAETSSVWPSNESWFANIDIAASMLGSIPVNGMTDWVITFILQQQTAIKNAALSIYDDFKDKLRTAGTNTPVVPNISNEMIHLLEKTAGHSNAEMARKLREDITNHNANIQISQMQLQIDNVTKQRDAEETQKILAEKYFSDEQKMHNNTKQEKHTLEAKLNSSEQALSNTQIAMADLSQIYQALVVKSSEIIAQQVSKTGTSELADQINGYIKELQSAASQHGKETEASELLEKIAELVKSIPDIAQQTTITLGAGVQDIQAAQPNILNSPSSTQTLQHRLDNSGAGVHISGQYSGRSSSDNFFANVRNNNAVQTSVAAPNTPIKKESKP